MEDNVKSFISVGAIVGIFWSIKNQKSILMTSIITIGSALGGAAIGYGYNSLKK
jgi:hypothetical protein